VARVTCISGGVSCNAGVLRDRRFARGFAGADTFLIPVRADLRLSFMPTLGVGLVEGAPGLRLLLSMGEDRFQEVVRVGSLKHLGEPVQVRPEARDDDAGCRLCGLCGGQAL
jgi:hypothetical protein